VQHPLDAVTEVSVLAAPDGPEHRHPPADVTLQRADRAQPPDVVLVALVGKADRHSGHRGQDGRRRGEADRFGTGELEGHSVPGSRRQHGRRHLRDVLDVDERLGPVPAGARMRPSLGANMASVKF
jgi:hypothetical protein